MINNKTLDSTNKFKYLTEEEVKTKSEEIDKKYEKEISPL